MGIPGWKKISKAEVYDEMVVGDTCIAPQEVGGCLYVPDAGGGSLQKLWDEYMELVWQDYHHHTAVGDGGKRRGVVSDGDDAIRILREWGKLDAGGHITEETKRERGR